MKTISRFFSFFFFCSSLLISQEPFPNFDSYMSNSLSLWKIPGAAVAVVKNGKIIFEKGFGVRELGKPEKVDQNTIFAVASNSKAFTALAICMLEEEKKLSLDDHVQKYLPYFQLYDSLTSAHVTIRDLLCHRLGFDTWQGDFVAWGTNYSREEIVRRMREMKPKYEFRTKYGYCNTAFLTAGEIILKVTGKPWDDFVKERFFTPLGMTHSSTSITEFSKFDNIAMPHTMWNNKLVVEQYRNLDHISAAASINSSAHDLARWLILQMDTANTIAKFSTIKKTHTPTMTLPSMPYGNQIFPSNHFVGYGLGWFLRDYHGRMMINHSGGADGFVTMTVFFPEEKVGFVILTNTDSNNLISSLMYQLADAYLGEPWKDWNEIFFARYRKNEIEDSTKWAVREQQRDEKLLPSVPLKDFAGIYSHHHYGDAHMSFEKGKLSLRMLAHPNLVGEVKPWRADTLICYWNDPTFDKSVLTFTVNKKSVEGFTTKFRPDYIDPEEYTFRKK